MTRALCVDVVGGVLTRARVRVRGGEYDYDYEGIDRDDLTSQALWESGRMQSVEDGR